MSSLLHPVGPQRPQTYWLRRLLVVLATLAALALVLAAARVFGNDGQAVPPVPGSASPTADPTPDPSPSATDPSSNQPTPDSSAPPAASPSPATTPSPTATPPPVCDAADLRATITGKQQVKVKESLTFQLSLINGGAVACRIDLGADTFELKIYSGADRIWSTADCGRDVKEIKQTVGPEKALEWQLTWNGKRSADQCRTRPEVPKPGTYFATAQFDGAKPVQLRMALS